MTQENIIEVQEEICKIIDKVKPKSVINFRCGETTNISSECRKIQAYYTGCDVVRYNTWSQQYGNYIKYDVLEQPFLILPPYNIVIVQELLEIKDRDYFAYIVSRLLEDTSILILSIPNKQRFGNRTPENSEYTKLGIEHYLKEYHFKIIECRPITLYLGKVLEKYIGKYMTLSIRTRILNMVPILASHFLYICKKMNEEQIYCGNCGKDITLYATTYVILGVPKKFCSESCCNAYKHKRSLKYE